MMLASQTMDEIGSIHLCQRLYVKLRCTIISAVSYDGAHWCNPRVTFSAAYIESDSYLTALAFCPKLKSIGTL